MTVEPITEFKDGNIFAYLNGRHYIAIWVRQDGSWVSAGYKARASDDIVFEATEVAQIEDLLGNGHVEETLTYYTTTANDLRRWTLVTENGTTEGTAANQPRLSFPYSP